MVRQPRLEANLKLLVVDTCSPSASFVLADTTSSAHRLIVIEGRSASERLIAELRAGMESLGWTLADLAAVGVVSGPGSFTGARIGIAAAKGLCEAADRPLVMISRLAVLAHKASADRAEIVHALLRAGRGELFYRRSTPGEPAVEALLSRDAVLETTPTGLIIVCEPEVQQQLPERHILLTSPLTASDALPLVAYRVEQHDFDDVATADANYLRRTELEVLEILRRRAETA